MSHLHIHMRFFIIFGHQPPSTQEPLKRSIEPRGMRNENMLTSMEYVSGNAENESLFAINAGHNESGIEVQEDDNASFEYDGLGETQEEDDANEHG